MINRLTKYYGDCEFERTINQMWKKTTAALKEEAGDVHTRIMKRNYEQVPEWWFLSILFIMTILALICCEGFGKQLQLPWWGVLLSLTIALVFTLPVGVIQATTNQVIFCLKPLFPKGRIIFRLSNTSRN
jgi:hypothetical protein